MEVSSTAIPVTESSQAGHARRTAAALAARLGFSEEAQGKVAIVVSEAAKNLVAHAREGFILLRALHAGPHVGVEVLALDKGPGIADVERCLRDGFSTAGTSGVGLGAMRRMATVFDIHSVPGVGTALLAQLWADKPPPASGVEVGAVCVPMAGEEVCGDSWAVDRKNGHFVFLVADGLGHGPEAARASRAAVVSFLEQGPHGPVELLRGAHQELRSTRGAAVSFASLDGTQLHYAGVGNISAAVMLPEGSVQRLVSMNGTLGHQAPRMQQFSYPWNARATLVMCSDGLATQWRLDAYPGLLARHPSLVAGVLYRDFVRGRDDATVLVAREVPRGESR
ncbi:anti-sigma regulatory factor (Ser/Thr protein kinase) [Archangium gephyra]|uniref:Anti-sigma regulatory factor (Ser/Thr protein kinase) n=1 Tax=Archangium gephyra TaxID=48 RepID=A0AAC8Q2G5_9BACT|nr:ATP-binding SpoIIE family protein phosphatase [Archangium gephyra]AKI99571.1 Phosphoserine phosphatase rsbX [Archangium gephyra]REG27892.1 anti-sigma regulatory factor (Ser/Thr protein kinase) [Archangium gephyra]